MAESRSSLRRRLRDERRAISEPIAQSAAVAVRDRIAALPQFRAADRIAVYVPFDGELDPGPIAALCAERKKRVFLPAVESPAGVSRMVFRELAPESPLVENRYGIWEPGPNAKEVPARWLDIVITPLVGFTARGDRLGMGAGYFDRTFSFLNHRSAWRKPRLIGVGYERQKVETLDVEHWDVPLWCIATECHLYKGVNR